MEINPTDGMSSNATTIILSSGRCEKWKGGEESSFITWKGKTKDQTLFLDVEFPKVTDVVMLCPFVSYINTSGVVRRITSSNDLMNNKFKWFDE